MTGKGLARLAGWALWLSLAVLAPLAFGMGTDGEGSESPTSIPHPEVNYRVKLTDSSGMTVGLSGFAIDGKPYIIGRLGAGQAAVPFAKVDKAALANGEEGLTAKVLMKGGASLAVLVNGKLFATGAAGYGNYKIRLREVRSLVFLGRVE